MPKKAPTKTPKLPRNYAVNGKLIRRVWIPGKAPAKTKFGAKLSRRVVPDHRVVLDTAIERGERLEKIVKIIEKRNADARYYGGDYFPDDYSLLVKILKLAKGA